MAKPTPPKLAPSEIPRRHETDIDRFLERLYFRIHNNVDEMNRGNLNAQWVAFEALGAVFPLLAEGARHQQVKVAYPIANWRESTVEVPTELISALVTAWNDFYSGSKTLGQSFGFEKMNRQGCKPMKSTRKKLDETLKLSNEALVAYIQLGDEEASSLEQAIAQVAEANGVSESKVERAYARYGQRTLETLKVLPNLDFIPGKTSKIGDVDE